MKKEQYWFLFYENIVSDGKKCHQKQLTLGSNIYVWKECNEYIKVKIYCKFNTQMHKQVLLKHIDVSYTLGINTYHQN